MRLLGLRGAGTAPVVVFAELKAVFNEAKLRGAGAALTREREAKVVAVKRMSCIMRIGCVKKETCSKFGVWSVD